MRVMKYALPVGGGGDASDEICTTGRGGGDVSDEICTTGRGWW